MNKPMPLPLLVPAILMYYTYISVPSKCILVVATVVLILNGLVAGSAFHLLMRTVVCWFFIYTIMSKIFCNHVSCTGEVSLSSPGAAHLMVLSLRKI
jgi:hypothetical protein